MVGCLRGKPERRYTWVSLYLGENQIKGLGTFSLRRSTSCRVKGVGVSCDCAGSAIVYRDKHLGVKVELGAPLKLPKLSSPNIGVPNVNRRRP